MVYDISLIEALLEGYWYRKPQKDWFTDHIDINRKTAKRI